MTKSDCERTEEEIDKLLNDPETPMYPDRIWALAEALAQGSCAQGNYAQGNYAQGNYAQGNYDGADQVT